MQVLRQFKSVEDKDLLVGPESFDDAGVYRVSPDKAIILTIDFFPPIVDDPSTFGRICAANALSDIYAMGAEPSLVMNVVCFPEELPISVLNDIISGSMEKLNEAGAIVVGGHSIVDKEVKFGLSVTGFVHPDKIIKNSGARPGDKLILTKPIGTGVLTSAMKAGRAAADDAEAAIKSMVTLNREASRVMVSSGSVNACTDITGFGLLGHSMEVAKASAVGMEIEAKSVALLPGALSLIKKKKNRPKNIKVNMEYLEPDIEVDSGIDQSRYMLLFDPQTSGGLLISIPEERSAELMDRLIDAGVEGSIIGSVTELGPGPLIKVI
jgi:selenide,water dikinase